MRALAQNAWKTVIICGMMMLTVAGVGTALANLPIVSGSVPR